ncbi:T9SS type A sorting domain-containing protein [Sphingobacterium bovistauri]|uniref:T9SS type A sorting domain-containing protein n=1 Tax=Sphingobacterium bovistauri TaxID=2781959 RepID=A0ABS7Z4M4_9SPHI|nr:T9SS type A sorting domain-containing protein [Sphingobacterium bovistauri]MCA5005130.1 T9SS type A sorting domain-containing protein [Sphingobacterium bovistauri]
MRSLKLKVSNMLKVRVFALSIFAFGLIGSHVYAISAPSYVFENEKDNQDKLITNVKASYNPVVEQIVVSFKLSKQSNVTIKLMDALGNEVLHLFNGSLEEGNQNQLFDTNEKVSPGFYFLRVASGSETVVKRISIK